MLRHRIPEAGDTMEAAKTMTRAGWCDKTSLAAVATAGRRRAREPAVPPWWNGAACCQSGAVTIGGR